MNVKKISNLLTIPTLFLLWGIFFQWWITCHLKHDNFNAVKGSCFIFIVVIIEAVVFLIINDYVKKDFFLIEKFKSGGTHPDKWIFKKIRQLQEKEGSFIIKGTMFSFLYIILFIIGTVILGPVVNTLLFRNIPAYKYPGMWNTQTLTPLIICCIVSTLWKYITLHGVLYALDNILNFYSYLFG